MGYGCGCGALLVGSAQAAAHPHPPTHTTPLHHPPDPPDPSPHPPHPTHTLLRKIHNPRILLLDCPLEYKKGENQTNVELTREEDW